MHLNPYAGTYLTDPAATWRVLLERPEPVVYAEDLGLWLICRHAEVKAALADPETFANALTLAPVHDPSGDAIDILIHLDVPRTTAAADAPTHTRTRRALQATFAGTPLRAERRYGAIVGRRVNERVAALAARRGHTVDLAREFCTLLPLQVICDIVGIPDEAVPMVQGWADGQIALVWGRPDAAEQVRLANDLLTFWGFCQGVVAGRAAQHEAGQQAGEDFIGRALRYRNGDDAVLTEAEVASLAFNLLVAGHETTAGLLAHALDQALSAPHRWDRLVEDPTGAPAFVEETLRFSPAIDAWLRVTSRDVTIGGSTIPAGARCLLMLGAANRDPAVFTDPDRFDPHRGDGRDHLTFGYGPHFCIGAALARLEASVALTRLAADVPGLRLAPDHARSFKPNVAFRAHRALPVVVG